MAGSLWKTYLATSARRERSGGLKSEAVGRCAADVEGNEEATT